MGKWGRARWVWSGVTWGEDGWGRVGEVDSLLAMRWWVWWLGAGGGGKVK